MKPEEEINKLKTCLKEKDKRIKKIEGYFWWRNRLLLSGGAGIVFILPWALFVTFVAPVSKTDIIPPFVLGFAIVGAIILCVLTVLGLLFTLFKIWED